MNIIKKLFSKEQPKNLSDKIVILDSPALQSEGEVAGVFGIRIYNNEIAPFVNKGSEYPCSGAFTFSTMHDGQDQIKVEFHFSKSGVASAESHLKTFEISGFKERKANVAMVRVYFELNDSKISVWASDEVGNRPLSLKEISA
jgi:molecular chaperone DnaK (HSP70)